MPALFDHAAVRPVRRHQRRTIVVSLVVHLALLTGLIVTQLAAALDALPDHRGLDRFVVMPAPPDLPPEPAPPAAPRPTLTANPDAAPVQANAVVLDTPPPRPAAAQGPPRPGALATADPSRGLGVRGTPAATTALAAPPPPPPVRPGGEIARPQRTAYVEPLYPEIAKAARAEGTVILEATIDATGVVRDVRVLRSIALLDQAAVEAVRQWRYTPTRLNGVPVPVVMTVTVTFTLR